MNRHRDGPYSRRIDSHLNCGVIFHEADFAFWYFDFNDDLIPLGATYWVRLAEAWLAPTHA